MRAMRFMRSGNYASGRYSYNRMPDRVTDASDDDEYIPWDVDGQDDDLGNYDYGESGFEDE